MIHSIYAIIQFSITMVDENGLQLKESKHMEDYGFEAKKLVFDSRSVACEL